jgi:hypothetical protein
MKDTGTGKTVQFYFIFRDLLIREYSLIGWLLFNVTRLVSQFFQCYYFLYQYKYYNFLFRSCDQQNGVSEWSLLDVKWSILQLYHDENKLILMRLWWCPLYTRYIYSASSLNTTVRGCTCRSTRTHYSDSEQTSLYSYSLVLHA